jgi:hypothetical protein
MFSGPGTGTGSGVRASVEIPVPAGTLENLRVRSQSPEGDSVYVEVYVVVDGNITALSCGVTAGSGCEDTVHTVTVPAGSLVSLAIYSYTAGPSALIRTNYSLEFQPATPPQ